MNTVLAVYATGVTLLAMIYIVRYRNESRMYLDLWYRHRLTVAALESFKPIAIHHLIRCEGRPGNSLR